MGHQTMKQENSIWFANEKKNRSFSKGIVFSDIGSLTIQHEGLEFKGLRLKFQVSNIKQVSIARQQIPWLGFLFVDVLLVVVFSILAKGNFEFLPFLPPIILLATAFGAFMSHSTKWVKIEYYDDKNETHLAFFADGSFLGWGGFLGGTENLYQNIKAYIFNYVDKR